MKKAFRCLINTIKIIIIIIFQRIIPHDIIENSIPNPSVKVSSPISFMKVGFTNDEYGHTESFRHQRYIHYVDND